MDDISETLELILWCAALATWLTLLFRFMMQPSKALLKRVRAWSDWAKAKKG
jgi:hypothetical protein